MNRGFLHVTRVPGRNSEVLDDGAGYRRTVCLDEDADGLGLA